MRTWRRFEDLIKQTIAPGDFHTIVSNIGVTSDFSALYTQNSGAYMATIQTQLNDDHHVGRFEYMDQVQRRCMRATRNCGLSFRADRWWMRS